jgi:hypothetical protein
MDKEELKALLSKVAEGEISIDDAVLKIKAEPYKDLDFAKIDTHRGIRQGVPEVIYGAGKTRKQIFQIVNTMKENGQKTILITRLREEDGIFLEKELNMHYDNTSKIGIVGTVPKPDGIGTIVVATAGTSDIPVAEEAAVTAEAFGNKVSRIYDVGVAGIHRLFDNLDELMLASVIGGLVDCPVIAVPTSVGYGANFEGLSALLSMLNSCASGVSVVNIDNGFGAGYLASMINHMGGK